MGEGHGHVAHLFDRLAAAADGLGDALVAVFLDAIGIDVEHEGADFAAGSGDRHGRKAWDATRLPGPVAAARTASHRKVRQRVSQPGLILAAAAGWGMVRWCPGRFRGASSANRSRGATLQLLITGLAQGRGPKADSQARGSKRLVKEADQCSRVMHQGNAEAPCSRPITIAGQAHGSAAGIPNGWR